MVEENLDTELDETTLPGEETPAPGDEGGGQSPSGDEPPAPDAKKDGVQERINTLTKKRREAERDAAYWKGVAEGKTPIPDEAPLVQKELDPTDFSSDADYLKAVAKQIRTDIRAENKADQEKQEETSRKAKMVTMLQDAREKYPDFSEVALSSTVPITQSMMDAAGENLGDVLYFLGSNPAEASRISLLEPMQQAKEIGKVEVRLTTKPTKKKTNAPPPPGTLKGGGGSPPPKGEAAMSRAELHAKWEKKRRQEAGLEA